MARRKTGDYHMRIDPSQMALWQARADELGLSVSAYLEAVAARDIRDSERARLLNVMYPNGRDRHEEYV